MRILRAGIVIAALGAAAATASAQGTATGPLHVSDPMLAASVERLATESPSWRAAIDAVAADRASSIPGDPGPME